MPSALIINRVQNDYCDGGPCGISGILKVIPIINDIKKKFDIVIFIKELNSFNHNSFIDYGGDEPSHCVKNTTGADLVQWLNLEEIDYIINIQTLVMYASDSAFYNAKTLDFKKESKLNMILKQNNIDEVFLCGVNIEKFLFPTALDTMRFGYNCTIIIDCCNNPNNKDTNDSSINVADKEKVMKCFKYLETVGVKLISSVDT